MLGTGWEHLLNSTLFKLGQLADHISYVVCGGRVRARLWVTSATHQPAKPGLREAYAFEGV